MVLEITDTNNNRIFSKLSKIVIWGCCRSLVSVKGTTKPSSYSNVYLLSKFVSAMFRYKVPCFILSGELQSIVFHFCNGQINCFHFRVILGHFLYWDLRRVGFPQVRLARMSIKQHSFCSCCHTSSVGTVNHLWYYPFYCVAGKAKVPDGCSA